MKLLRSYAPALGLALLLMATLAAPAGAAGSQAQSKPGQPIVIRWSTETEVNTAGFNIYRAEDEDGPWTKINTALIPGSPDPLRGGSYVFTDTNVIAGQSYLYELEEVELGGTATRLERTQAVAQSQGMAGLGALPCPGGVALFLPFGIILAWRARANAEGPARFRRSHETD